MCTKFGALPKGRVESGTDSIATINSVCFTTATDATLCGVTTAPPNNGSMDGLSLPSLFSLWFGGMYI